MVRSVRGSQLGLLDIQLVELDIIKDQLVKLNITTSLNDKASTNYVFFALWLYVFLCSKCTFKSLSGDGLFDKRSILFGGVGKGRPRS